MSAPTPSSGFPSPSGFPRPVASSGEAEPLEALTAPSLPIDAHVADRLRAGAHHAWLLARTPALHLSHLLHRRSTPPAPTLVHHLLVLRTDRIGDLVLSTPLLTDLRAHYRHARITVLAPPQPLSILHAHPAVDRLLPLDGAGLPEEVRGRFDLVLDLTPDATLQGALLARATGAPWRAGFRAAGREVFFTLPSPPAQRERHIVDLNRDLLEALGVPAHTTVPVVHLTPAERKAAEARTTALGAAAPRVVVHPGGHYPSQRWAPERFAEVIARLTEQHGAACLVVSGPGEERLAERIASLTPDALLPGPLDVRGLMGILALADLYVGNNSGPLHLAAALGVPTLSLMGPSDPRRFTPRGVSDSVLRLALPCSPCQRGRCWHHTCLAGITPSQVASRASALLRYAALPKAA
jgi:ADP-heptose:LPS heptosyltransferase